MASSLTDSMASAIRNLLKDPDLAPKARQNLKSLLERYDEGEDDDVVESCCA